MKYIIRVSPGPLLSLLFLVAGCGEPPALESAEAFSTTDALYTAITSHRPELLDESAVRLKTLAADGKLSSAALESLDAIIRQAQSGNWQEAAENLDSFIRHQLPHEHSH